MDFERKITLKRERTKTVPLPRNIIRLENKLSKLSYWEPSKVIFPATALIPVNNKNEAPIRAKTNWLRISDIMPPTSPITPMQRMIAMCINWFAKMGMYEIYCVGYSRRSDRPIRLIASSMDAEIIVKTPAIAGNVVFCGFAIGLNVFGLT